MEFRKRIGRLAISIPFMGGGKYKLVKFVTVDCHSCRKFRDGS